MQFYRTEFFDIEELVDRQTFERWGEKAWMFFRPEVLYSLDGIRKHFDKPVWVNNWIVGGKLQWRGLRTKDCIVGDSYSQHRFANAFDCDIEGIKAEDVRREIIKEKDDPLLIHITCLETDITWVHFDCRNIQDRITIVKP